MRLVRLLTLLLTLLITYTPVVATGYTSKNIALSYKSEYIGNGVARVETRNKMNPHQNTKIIVEKDGTKQYYVFNKSEVNIPLNRGKGNYTIKVASLVNGNRYKVNYKTTVHLNEELTIEQIYTQSINKVDYAGNENITKLSNLLYTENGQPKVLSNQEKVTILYKHITANMKYDYDKLTRLTADYMPETDKFIIDKKGICYDYSSVFAGVLRLNGIPTKLVTGYAKITPNTYHAWNEVYIDGEWKIIDTTFDAVYIQQGIKTNMYKNITEYTVDKFY